MDFTAYFHPYRLCYGIMAAMIAASTAGCGPSSSHTPKVRIVKEGQKYTLYRNGAPFAIKGGSGFTYLPQLQAAGGNTIRIWDTAGLGKVLDEAQANNLAVIAGFPMPVSGQLDYYKNPAEVQAQYNAFQTIVNRYKSHPALLMWCLGNEVDFPFRPRYEPFYRAYNRLVNMIHSNDPDHPVTTAIINLNYRSVYNIRMKIRGLDLISLNIFGRLQELPADLDQLAWAWSGPFLVTEWGINGPWESETTAWGAPVEHTSTWKADQYLQRYRQLPLANPRFLGACVFYWGHKQEVTHTWFSLFGERGETSEAVNAMQFLWTGKRATPAPALNYMLLGGKGARDNIMLRPGVLQTAELVFAGTPADSTVIHWEILKEDWFIRNPTEANTVKPAALQNLLASQNGHTAVFRAPAKRGPYRIFATVTDNKGRFSTANTPFYVIE